jgi:hypothetical protein
MSPFNLTDFIGLSLGFLFTMLIFSYILGDNPLFRLASHIFIGVTAGYAAIITINNVLVPRLILPLFTGSSAERLLSLLIFIPSLFLFAKITPLRKAGNWSVAILVGIGAASAIGGTITGTLFPQLLGTINSFETPSASSSLFAILNGVLMILGTITTLVYFHFGTGYMPGQTDQQLPFIQILGKIGHVFIAITLGVLFAGVYISALSALVERLSFLWDYINQIQLQIFSF